jgi:nucleoside 2-deoxyribosyltransferase
MTPAIGNSRRASSIRRVYLAGPFFTPGQVELIKALEKLIESIEPRLGLFSPRRDGIAILQDLTLEQKLKAAGRVFEQNKTEIHSSDMVFAVIDDRDPGTIWELGYAARIRYIAVPKIVTFTNHNYGVNVMVQMCADGHCKGIDLARDLLSMYAAGDDAWEKDFRDFNEGVF